MQLTARLNNFIFSYIFKRGFGLFFLIFIKVNMCKYFLPLLNELEKSDSYLFSGYLAIFSHYINHDSSRHLYTLIL